MKADRLWCENQGLENYKWGIGAGPVPNGYHANKINDNEYVIYSPEIMAGYLTLN